VDARDDLAAPGALERWRAESPPPRAVTCAYADPLDLVWLAAAARLGRRVARSADMYASWDGAGTLILSAAEHMDPDDTLAQLIFHEACHALVEGPAGWGRPDWGLENADARHLVNELACHRAQAALAARHGLRDLLAVTTDWRPHYDALPADPLAPCAAAGALDEEARALARAALARAEEAPWREALGEALRLTAALRALVAPLAPPSSLWARGGALSRPGA